MLLSDLNVGDKFYHKSMAEKTAPIYQVVEKETGTAGKIRCKNLWTGALINKMAKLEVIKSSFDLNPEDLKS